MTCVYAFFLYASRHQQPVVFICHALYQCCCHSGRRGFLWRMKCAINMCLFWTYRVAELDVADENDINWDLLAEGWSSVRSPQWLRSKWWTIKRQIANHKDVSFPGNVLLQVLPLLPCLHLRSYSSLPQEMSKPVSTYISALFPECCLFFFREELM